MTVAEWTEMIIAAIAVITAFAGGVRWLVKNYLHELQPNSGSSVKDQVTRLEQKVDQLYVILLNRGEH